jgi:simple sugar transport system permease protein
LSHTTTPRADTKAPAPKPASSSSARALALRFLTLREGSIIVVTVLAAIYFSLKTDRFFTHANFVTLLPYFAPFAILAVGEVLLMVAGEIDLSIGSVYLFAPFMFYEFHGAGLGLVACLICALIVSSFVGLLNGLITEVFGVSSFITTLGIPSTSRTSSTARRSPCPSRSTRSGRSPASSAPGSTRSSSGR